MPRKAKTEPMLRGKCRHCGEALIYHQCDEKTERWGEMVYRSDKPRWWHLNPDVPEPETVPLKEGMNSLVLGGDDPVPDGWTKVNDAPPPKQVNDSIYMDTTWGPLGAYCKIKDYEEENLRGQAGEPAEYCVVLKGDWPQQFCLNPVQDTELFMCGVHAKRERERQRQRKESHERREGADAHNDGREEVVRRILENWGLHVEATRWGTWDGKITMDHEELETLLQSLEQEYKAIQNRRKKSA